MPEGQKKALVEGRSPPQELEEGLCSGPHLLVILNTDICRLGPPTGCWAAQCTLVLVKLLNDDGRVPLMRVPRTLDKFY